MKVILGVSASIALYKACDLVRNLTKAGIEVNVAMTHTAQTWISPLIFEALSGQKVYQAHSSHNSAMGHIDIRERANLMVVAPATAHIIAKLAYGFADDIISATALAFNGPLWIAPSMNPFMYAAKATQDNISLLKKRNVTILEPQDGEAICGDVGEGKMMAVEDIFRKIIEFGSVKKI